MPVIGIEVVFSCVAANPADRGLAVVNLGRPNRLTAETVANRNTGVMTSINERGDGSRAGVLAAVRPASAMYKNNNG